MSYKKPFIILTALTLLAVGLLIMPKSSEAGVPYIKDVYYVSPNNMYIQFTESMNTTTIATTDFELTTEISGDTETVTAVQFSTNENPNDSVLITASGAIISPSYNDYIKVTGAMTSATGDDLNEPYPWAPMIPHGDVKISEIQIAGTNTTDEFIELYNRLGSDISMDGYKLTYVSSAGSETTLINDFGAVNIGAEGGYYLIANAAYTGLTPTADVTYASSTDIAADGTIILYAGAAENNRILDLVGFGNAPIREGSTKENPVAGESAERKATSASGADTMCDGCADSLAGNAYDSDNNSYDLIAQGTPNPQSSVSTKEVPTGFGSGGDTGMPMIMHMGLWQAKIGQPLQIIAQSSDPETPSNALATQLYYKPNAGSWTSVSGVHIANGYFKFMVPASAVADTNGFAYYLKSSDGTNCRYMSASPTADMANSGACPGSEPTDIQSGAWQVNGNAGADWNKDMQGHVYGSDCSTAIIDALVFAEGTGFADLTDINGTFDLTNLYPGNYNITAVAPGYMEQFISGVEADAQWPAFCMYEGSGGSGGDLENPHVIWSAPMEGMMSAPVDISLTMAPIYFAFDKQLDSTTVASSSVLLKYWDGSQEVAVSGYTVGYYEPGDTISGAWTASDYMIVISSTAQLDFGKDYMVTITPGVKDTAGNPVSGNNPTGGHKLWFNTGFDMGAGGATTFTQGGGAMPPFVIGTVPKPGITDVPINSKIFIQFTEPLDSTSLSASTIQLWKLNSSMTEVSQDTAVTVTLEPNKKDMVILTPSANFTPDTWYMIKVRGDVQSTNGMCLMPECATTFAFTSEFKTWTTASADSAAPTVSGYSLDMYKSAGSITGVPVSLGNIEVFFSKGIDPTTINTTNITLKAGTSEVSGDAEYDPMAKSARFYPSVALVPNTAYVLTVKGGLGKVKDARFPGTVLAVDATCSFTTGGADSVSPSVMFAAADDFRIAVTFSEPMNDVPPGDPNYTSSVLNKGNYAIQYKGPGDVSFLNASAEAIANLMIKYDNAENTAMLEGLDFYDHMGHDFKVTITGVKDRASNTIDTSANVGIGKIENSMDTGGMMGPGSMGMMGPTGGGMDFMNFGMKPCGAWPMNMIEGMTSHYFIDLPTSVALNSGDQILLTFPTGFNVANAVPVSTSESPVNSDLNEFGPGTVIFDNTFDSDGVQVNGQTITIQLSISGTGLGGGSQLPADDFLHFDLKGIKNGKAQGTDTLNSQGYSVSIKSKRVSSGAILENFSTMPFFLTPGGDLSISGQVRSGVTGINGVTVFLGSPMTGPMEALSANNAASGGQNGEYIFTDLPQGDYHLFTKPFMTIGGTDYLGDPMPQHIWLSSSATNQSITIKNPASAAVTAVTIKLKGNFGSDQIDIFAGSDTMMGQGGFTVLPELSPGNCTDYGVPGATCQKTLYLPTQSASTWRVGIGPAMPMGPMMMGPPPSISWMPPQDQKVFIDSGGTLNYPDGGSSINVGITAASEQIIGYVYDGKADGSNDLGTSVDYGQPVKDVDVDAHKREGFGMPIHGRTDADGKFTLSATAGTFFLNVWFPGMPPSPEKKVLIKDENTLTDGNTASDVYIDGSIPVTTASPLVFKLGKGGYTISGTVSDGSNPAAYTPVWAWNESTGQNIPSGTDSSGNFTLYVGTGVWKIQANIPGKGDVPPQSVTIPTSESDGSKRNLVLQPLGNAATVSGTVKLDTTGQGWAHVWITGTDSQGNFFENGMPTRPDGTYTLSIAPGSGYMLYAHVPGYGDQAPITIGAVAANQTLTNKNFTVSTANLSTLTFVFNNSSNLDGKEAWVDVFNLSTAMGQGQHISNVNSIQDDETVKVSAGQYNIRAHIPGFGEYQPTTPVPVNGLVTLSSGASVVTFDLPTTGYTVSGIVFNDVNGDGIYAVGADSPVTEGFAWLDNWNKGYHGGDDVDSSDGTYSIFVPGGADQTYYLGADVPGYTGSAPVKISGIIENLSNRNIPVTANNYSISGQIVDSSGNGVPYAWVWAEKVTSAADLTELGGHNHTEADKDGNYTLSAGSGYWRLHAAGAGFTETKKSTAVDGSTNPTGCNLALNAIANYTAKSPKIKNVKPSEGGVIDDIANTGVKLTVPATALGNGTDYGKITITEKSGGGTDIKTTLANTYYEIKATDSSGAAISGQLSQPIEVEIHYDDGDLPTGYEEDQVTFASMGTSGGWQEDTFTIDPDNNVIRVKLTHLSSVAVTYPADSDRPSTPGTPAVTAGDGQVALSWTASTDNVSVAGYEVYRSTSADGTFTNISGDCETTGSFDSSVLVTAVSYTDSTASNGTTYYYKVTAYDNSGNASADPSSASAAAAPAAVSSGGGPVTLSQPTNTAGQVTVDVSLGGETTITSLDNITASAKLSANAVDSTTVVNITPEAKADIVAPLPANKSIIGNYIFNYTAISGTEAITTFNNPVVLTFTYTDEQVSGLDESLLQVYRWDETAEVWIALDTIVNAEANTLTASTTHFSYFAIIGGLAEETTIEEPAVISVKPISEMTNEELQTEIVRILSLISQLQTLLAQMTDTGYAGCTISSFDRNLSQGMTGADVKCLQIVLNSAADTQAAASGVGSAGNETDYFGSLTKGGVIKFQEKYAAEVLAEHGFTAGTGYVGRTTKAKLNSLLGK